MEEYLLKYEELEDKLRMIDLEEDNILKKSEQSFQIALQAINQLRDDLKGDLLRSQIEPKQAKPFGTIQIEMFLPKLAQFEPKCLAQLDRKGWRNSNRYIHPSKLSE